nr:trehalase family glycosidase [Candidatus Njordarchaeota archaeon]
MKGKGRIAALGFIARLPLRIVAEASTPGHATFAETSYIDDALLSAKRRYERDSIKIKGGPFDGCAQAVTSVLNWCVAWDQLHERPYTLISRAWIDKADKIGDMFGFDKVSRGPFLAVWDTLFNALLHSIDDQDLAESNVRALLDDLSLIDGVYPPNYITPIIRSGDRSQPPIGSLVTWKLYKKFKNTKFLEWVYPRLKRWHCWWKENRDGNKDGLLEWGSTFGVKEPGNEAGTLNAAKYESGMDNSPLYDDAKYNHEIGTMNMSDIGLNSMYAADAMYLSIIANELSLQSDSEKFLKEYKTLVKKINEELWNDEETAYLDRYWDGKFSTRIAPTSFYPMIARTPSSERARRIVERHICNDDEFWGKFVIPSISRKDPAFNEQLYWRGRIWPPMNYLVYLGLKAYEMDEIAYEFAKKSALLFMNEWREEGHCHENYNAITGEGDDVPTLIKPFSEGSDRFYSWGALLALMGIEELLDVEIDEGMRFGCRFLEEKSILLNASLAGSFYRIETSQAETRAFRDGKNFFCSKPGTNIRNYITAKNSVRFRASGNRKTHFTICEFDPNSNVLLTAGSNTKETLKSDPKGAVSFDIELRSRYTQFMLEQELK